MPGDVRHHRVQHAQQDAQRLGAGGVGVRPSGSLASSMAFSIFMQADTTVLY